MKLVIVDYGAGNLRSVAYAFRACVSGEVCVSANPSDVLAADKIVLPGVGAFAAAKTGIDEIAGLRAALDTAVLEGGCPFLGICVGMHLFADESSEHGRHAGFGWIGGKVRALPEGTKTHRTPHMGWNTLRERRAHPLMEGLDGADVYFAHSYHFVPDAPKAPDAQSAVCATSAHSVDVVAMAARENIAGVQFHPEKSQAVGRRLIENFLGWRP